MLHEIAPHTFSNEYVECVDLTPDASSVLLVENEGRFLCCIDNGELRLPTVEDIPPKNLLYLVSIDKIRFYYYHSEEIDIFNHFLDDGFAWICPREIRYAVPAWLRFGTLVGMQLVQWYRHNHYCGKCGRVNEIGTTERSLTCPGCHSVVYPRINPCVIVGVKNNDKLLLTKYAGNAAYSKFALVAGFCEIGESAEQTVVREVKEETGLSVKNIRYYKSQPWPFSSSLLFGYFCDVEGDTQPHADGTELSVAQWVSKEEIPLYENEISLTYEMMDAFRRGPV